MADQASSELPRIAFVFGDAALAAHVREAMAGHAEIVYATSGTEFDAARLADAQVVAALVNIDGGDWLDVIEAKLQAAAVRVVFNDPEISQGLESWERARWLRHLAAKLRGSADFDPPRPIPTASSPVAVATNELPVVVMAPAVVSAPETVAGNEEATVERPLSPHEIETMTADFIAVPEMPDVDAPSTRPPEDLAVIAAVQVAPAAAQSGESPDRPEALSEDAVQAGLSSIVAQDTASMPAAEPGGSIDADTSTRTDSDAAGLLDVDTEALSAMIDARLAEPESHVPSDEEESWAISDVPAARASTEHAANDPTPGQSDAQHREGTSVPAPAGDAPTTPVVTAGDTDADVLASLPSLDDWRLLDPDAEVEQTPKPAGERKSPEPVLPDSFAGLELVPMETIIPIERNTDPIERWLDDTEAAPKAQADGNKT